MLEIRTHGRGGQGVVTYGDILAQAGLNAGFHVQTLPFFGVERRGASIRALLRLSETEIKKRSQCYNPDILVLFNDNQLAEAKSIGNCDNAVVVFNSPRKKHAENHYWVVDAESIAYKYGLTHGDDVFINIVMAGALAKVLKLSTEDLIAAIKTIRGVKDNDPNIKAALEAYSGVEEIGGKC
ncbi:MAG: 2-oxoacid:acceptor oxidoreductase family protein [Bacillota bacterium]|nr:2-oxoacid:acceptor oxidoreductase family protein [Bacillota bacterium]